MSDERPTEPGPQEELPAPTGPAAPGPGGFGVAAGSAASATGTPGAEPAGSAEPPKRGLKQWAVAGIVAALIAVGAGAGITVLGDTDDTASVSATASTEQAGATAANGQAGQSRIPGGPGTRGTITAIDDSSLTVEATDQSGVTSTVTVETTDDTAVTESVEGSLADVAEGDHVMVMGSTTDAGVTAERVVDNGDLEISGPGGGMGAPPSGAQPPTGSPDGSTSSDGEVTGGSVPSGQPPVGAPGGMGGGTAGTVTAVSTDGFTVETGDGSSVKVSVTADTTISITKVLKVSDLAKGDTVMVVGATTDSTVTASTIRRGELGAGGFGGGPGMTPPAGGTPPDPGESGSGSTTSTTTA